MSVHGYAQYPVTLFRETMEKAFYLGIVRVGLAQRRFGYRSFNPPDGNHSLRHYLNCVLGKYQLGGFGWHGVGSSIVHVRLSRLKVQGAQNNFTNSATPRSACLMMARKVPRSNSL